MEKIFKGLVLVFLLSATSCGAQKSMMSDAMTKRVDKLGDGLYVVINTNRGEILAKLFYTQTPLTVANFVALAEGRIVTDVKEGRYYDGIVFHRVISNFMIQTGDPRGNGTGGPGYQFDDEIVDGLNFDRPGLLAMANAGPATNGSQFFITHTATPHLNGKHTIFGEVLSGDDQKVVNAIAQKDVMNHVIIIAKGAEAEAFLADAERDGKVNPALMDKAEAARAAAFELENADNIAMAKALMPTHKVSPRGVYFVVNQEGSGEKVVSGQTVSVHYEGKLLSNGQVFDSSRERGEPIAFPAGVGYVIPGWDEMVLDMKVGEKRLVIIPSSLGYGPAGAGGVIPPNAWLIFDMELVGVK